MGRSFEAHSSRSSTAACLEPKRLFNQRCRSDQRKRLRLTGFPEGRRCKDYDGDLVIVWSVVILGIGAQLRREHEVVNVENSKQLRRTSLHLMPIVPH